jgi:hypothetical protein
MFLDNKYTSWYFSIIENSKRTSRSKKDGYHEKHHIIPKSCGGTDDGSNLVLLTSKEHFICHLLLPKMMESEYHYHKMIFALNAMSRPRGDKLAYTSAMYVYLRPKIAESIAALHRGKPKPGTSEKLKNRPKSDDHRAKLKNNLAKASAARSLKRYRLIRPNGSEIIVSDRKAFCSENDMSIYEFSRAAKSGKAYKGNVIIQITS